MQRYMVSSCTVVLLSQGLPSVKTIEPTAAVGEVHFPCHIRHHVLTMIIRSDIMSDRESHIKLANFQFYVGHALHGPHTVEPAFPATWTRRPPVLNGHFSIPP